MRRMNRIIWKLWSSLLAGVFLAGAMAGCKAPDQTRTILLPPLENMDESPGRIKIEQILDYTWDGTQESLVYPAFGMSEYPILYLLVRDVDNSHRCLTIDMERDVIMKDIFVDEADLFNIHFAPGGRYFSCERIVDHINQLVLFSLEDGSSQVLWELEGAYSYVWSADGTCLFTWQDGDGYDPYADWQVVRYEISDGTEEVFKVQREEFQMKGSGYAVRSVLPNGDGSEIYVREEFNPVMMSDEEKARVGMDKGMDFYDAGVSATIGTDSEIQMDGEPLPANNWLIRMDEMTMVSLKEFSQVPLLPVKYTQAGLFVRESGGLLCLIEDIGGQPKRTELFQTEGMDVCVCENGDHVFLAEWINPGTYQVSGARVLEGEALGRQILYRNSLDTVDNISVVGDHTVMFHSLEYSGNSKEDRYYLKIVSLEY